MSTDRDVTRIVRSWLDEGATALPDRVLDAVLDQVPTTPQRRASWPAWRLPEMSALMRYGLAAAALIGAVLLGFAVLRPNVGSPMPIASPSAETTPTSVASPGASSAPTATELRLVNNAGLMHMTVSLPARWQVGSAPGGVWVTLRGSELFLAEIGFYEVDNLYADACNPALGWRSPPLGPTPEDLVTAVTDLPTYAEASVTRTDVNGYPATHIERAGEDSPTLTPDCLDAGLSQYSQSPMAPDSVVGQVALAQYPDLWIADADGQRLLIVRYGHLDLYDEMDAILGSLRIGHS